MPCDRPCEQDPVHGCTQFLSITMDCGGGLQSHRIRVPCLNGVLLSNPFAICHGSECYCVQWIDEENGVIEPCTTEDRDALCNIVNLQADAYFSLGS